LIGKLNIELWKTLVRFYVCNISLYGSVIWALSIWRAVKCDAGEEWSR
jgi:hypothetical protein